MIKFLEKLVVTLYRRAAAKAAQEADKASDYSFKLAVKAREVAEHSEQIAAESRDHFCASVGHSAKADKLEEFFK